MKVAIKFDSYGNYASHCTDTKVRELKEIRPSSEGFKFYEITEEQFGNIYYCKLVKDEIMIDTSKKQSDIEKSSHMREMEEIEQWFENYDKKTSEHARCSRLNIVCPHNIEELDRQAVIYSGRLKFLRAANQNSNK